MAVNFVSPEYVTPLVKLFLLTFKFHSLWNSVNLWVMAFQIKCPIQQQTWCWVVTSDCIWSVCIYAYLLMLQDHKQDINNIIRQNNRKSEDLIKENLTNIINNWSPVIEPFYIDISIDY